MKAVAVIAIVLVAVGFWLVMRHRAQSRQAPGPATGTAEKHEDAGRGLRMMMLTTPAAKFGVAPTQEYPRVYGVLMDWPMDDEITATVFATSTGTASLYTTSTFGVIGGESHETVQNAAKAFVRAADRFFDSSTPTSEYPYPTGGRVRFYFLTFEGVRVIDADPASVTETTGAYSELFGLGQVVLHELLRIANERE